MPEGCLDKACSPTSMLRSCFGLSTCCIEGFVERDPEPLSTACAVSEEAARGFEVLLLLPALAAPSLAVEPDVEKSR